MLLSAPHVSSPDVEFVVRFVKLGAYSRPATWQTVTVRAADRSGARKILKQQFPRSERYEFVSQTQLLKAAA